MVPTSIASSFAPSLSMQPANAHIALPLSKEFSPKTSFAVSSVFSSNSYRGRGRGRVEVMIIMKMF